MSGRRHFGVRVRPRMPDGRFTTSIVSYLLCFLMQQCTADPEQDYSTTTCTSFTTTTVLQQTNITDVKSEIEPLPVSNIENKNQRSLTILEERVRTSLEDVCKWLWYV